MMSNDPAVIASALDDTTLWFIVGLGNNPERPAFEVSHELQARGKKIVPIYPRAEVVHGVQGFATIAEAAQAVGVPDVVDLFVRSDRAGEFTRQAIEVGARFVWMQLGVRDDESAQAAHEAGLGVVMDTCPLIEWPRLQQSRPGQS
jgi:predicted CoA-binding protein